MTNNIDHPPIGDMLAEQHKMQPIDHLIPKPKPPQFWLKLIHTGKRVEGPFDSYEKAIARGFALRAEGSGPIEVERGQ